uniref:Uncharacterized protein n=1 Tax=Aegilops tauschii subsp. strangulata TaxID=200361 RepID=A0A453ISM0_AEGTS
MLHFALYLTLVTKNPEYDHSLSKYSLGDVLPVTPQFPLKGLTFFCFVRVTKYGGVQDGRFGCFPDQIILMPP